MRPLRITAVVWSATVVLAVSACRPATPSGREALAAAVSTSLPFSARLSGGFAPSTRGTTRAGEAPALSPDTRIAIALLEKRLAEEPSPSALADVGVGYLIQGDVDRAIAVLGDAAERAQSAAPWSDLSAAYLVKADRLPARRVEYLARALEAAERSLRVSPSNEALFNRTFARDRLSPYTGAPAAWSEYAAVERDSAWRAAAERQAAAQPTGDWAADQWEARLEVFQQRLHEGDRAYVRDAVADYPEASLEFLERQVLVEWGRAISAGDAPRAQAALARARLLSSIIKDVTGDALPVEATAAVGAGARALAEAHVAYADGLIKHESNDLVGAKRAFSLAQRGFTDANAPHRWWTSVQLAAVAIQAGELAAAERDLAAVERDIRSRPYATLRGRLLRLRGLAMLRQWRLTEAIDAFRQSASVFEAASERDLAVGLYRLLGDTLRTLGEQQESWTYVGRTLEGLAAIRKPLSRYLLLYNATLFASSQQLYEAALLFQDATVRAAEVSGTDVVIEALVQRALVQVRRGDLAKARADVATAESRLASVPAGPFKTYVTAELDIVRARLVGDAASAESLRRAIGFFERAEPGRVPGLYLTLARLGGPNAQAALESGIASLERQQAGVGDEALKISYFDESWALFQDMVTLQASRGDQARAFEYAERSRARALLASAQGTTQSRTRTLTEIQPALPASVVLIHYTSLTDRVLAWTITSKASTLAEIRIDERSLQRLIDSHRTELLARRDAAAVNDRLYELLITPVRRHLSGAATVVLVPDSRLQQLAFATLRNPATGRFLIEDYEMLVTPSASFFVDARTAVATRGHEALSSALLIGDPGAAGTAPLPGAEAEASSAAKFYPRHELLTGRAASKERFLALAPAYDVVHFGGHAVVNPEYPLLSRLIFAGEDGDEQSLFAHEISRVRFPRTRVVMLAACSTAAGSVSRGEGVVGVARPFLAGGVPLVIASQWDVDDRATEQLSLAFHRELAASRNPVAALRAAQLALLRSGDPDRAAPLNWGAFVAVGTTAP
jgi:CHAT domain-containing protein